MKKFGNRNFNKKKQQLSGETIFIGEYMHSCDNLIICKLASRNIPYPGSPVLVNKEQIGKIDEIFGEFTDPHISIELTNKEDKELHKKGIRFQGYKEKFMFRERLLPREETLAKKEDEDKNARKSGSKQQNRKGGKKEYKKVKFDRIKKQMNKK